jgi:hypothetical protein
MHPVHPLQLSHMNSAYIQWAAVVAAAVPAAGAAAEPHEQPL